MKKSEPSEYTPDFEMFWKLYPDRWDRDMNRRIKRKKAPAFEKWRELSNKLKAECLMIAKQIKYSEGSNARDCVTWLNQKGWEEMRPDENKDKPTNAQIQEMVQGLLDMPPEKKTEQVWVQRKKLGL